MGESDWTCEARDDSTVRILAEGVDMSYAEAPTDDPEVFILGAVAGSVDGHPDEGRICEEALEWNAAHDTSLSLVGWEGDLRVVRYGDARTGLDADSLREAIRAVAEATALWRDRLGGARP